MSKVASKKMATKKMTTADPVPQLVSAWHLNFGGEPIPSPPAGLGPINSLTILAQAQTLGTNAISGVVTFNEETFFPLIGQCDEKGAVTFFVTDEDKVYLFTGWIGEDNKTMGGSFMIAPIPPRTARDDGNWSAKAEGGTDDDDDGHGPKPKPRRRSSR